jgi:hypothetical protein
VWPISIRNFLRSVKLFKRVKQTAYFFSFSDVLIFSIFKKIKFLVLLLIDRTTGAILGVDSKYRMHLPLNQFYVDRYLEKLAYF